MPRGDWQTRWREALEEIEGENRTRSLRSVDVRSARYIELDGQQYLNFSSNDYLGLSTHPAVKEAARKAVQDFGAGSGASRLISGNHQLYQKLESRLADVKNAEAALVFSSGYHAGMGLLSALTGPGNTILLDRLAHASLVDGARLSRARLKVFEHNSPESLKKRLKSSPAGQTLVVTESVFSMDGDVAPLASLVQVCEETGALLIVDDAHGFGVLGPSGRGAGETLEKQSPNLLIMGTLSKAMGSLGGYVTGPRLLVDFLVNRCRTLIYTTALPPSCLAASLAALRLCFEEKEGALLLGQLRENIQHLISGLKEKNFVLPANPTPIIPVLYSEEKSTLEAMKSLKEHGIFAPAIRPPTVPANSCRIRLSLSALHRPADIDAVIDTLPAIPIQKR
jgi:8-amino-7-oxononanoate synthase